jgi:hypothetical protein
MRITPLLHGIYVLLGIAEIWETDP